MTALPDRRDFLVRTGGAAGLAALLGTAACRDASREAAEAAPTGAPPTVLTQDEVRTLEAVADRILPPDGDAPGAKDLGAVVFIDRFVARDGGTLEGLRAALGVLAETAADVADRSPEQQDEALRTFEAHPSGLFGLVRFLPGSRPSAPSTVRLPERAREPPRREPPGAPDRADGLALPDP